MRIDMAVCCPVCGAQVAIPFGVRTMSWDRTGVELVLEKPSAIGLHFHVVVVVGLVRAAARVVALGPPRRRVPGRI